MVEASFTPYTYFQCPCSEHGTSPAHESSSRPSSSHQTPGGEAGGEADGDSNHTFDPRSPRANYSLYPLEYLLYCEDCHQIRCPRCVAEEIVTYYCPSCLFEVPTTTIKSDGNRCTRSCFQCPMCIGPLTATNLEPSAAQNLEGNVQSSKPVVGPDGTVTPAHVFILTCCYCQWMSTEIGITFDKGNALCMQMSRLRNGGKPRLVPRRRGKPRELGASIPSVGPSLLSGSTLASALDTDDPTTLSASTTAAADAAKQPVEEGLDMARQFSYLRHFYQKQMADHGGGTTALSPFGDLSFGSPASLSRLMNMWTGMPVGSNNAEFHKRTMSRLRGMREAREEMEGFIPAQLDESEAIARLHNGTSGGCNHPDDDMYNGWDITASAEQREAQAVFLGEDHQHRHPRFLDELRPIPVLLRTKRSKRCPLCRHIISKPEAKANNSRFRIRLVAGSYIPSISIRPMHQPAAAAPPPPAAKTSSRSAPVALPPPSNILEPLKPVQYILTFKNPIFESVKVTLAAPSTTPGRFASKVTVLCPQFEIDSNTDVWDDALRDSAADAGGSGGAGGSRGSNRRDDGGGSGGGGGQPIAGKIWERGRNWVSIVVEIVPPSLDLDRLAMASRPIGKEAEGQSKKIDLSPLREDEDIVEIPLSVRIEWETDAAQDGVGAGSGKDKDAKEKRELAYWCVLGIGRVRHD